MRCSYTVDGIEFFFVSSTPSDGQSATFASAVVRQVWLFVGVVSMQERPGERRTQTDVGQGYSLSACSLKRCYPFENTKVVRGYRHRLRVRYRHSTYSSSMIGFVEFAWAEPFAWCFFFLPRCCFVCSSRVRYVVVAVVMVAVS